MPDESEELTVPMLPGETPAQWLKRLSQMPRQDEKVRRVKATGLGPMSFFRLTLPAPEPEPEPELTPEEKHEDFKNYMNRRMRIARGLPPGPVIEESFRNAPPVKSTKKPTETPEE